MKEKNFLLKSIVCICLLSIIAYLISTVVSYFQTFSALRNLITDSNYNIMNETYIANSNIQLTMAITNLIIILTITIFITLYLLKILERKNILKLCVVSFIFSSIEIYLLQQFIVNLIGYVSLSQDSLAICITSILCLIVIAIGYLFFIFKYKTDKDRKE